MEFLDSELMNVLIEKFNYDWNVLAQNNPRMKKKYAFTQNFVVSTLFEQF